MLVRQTEFMKMDKNSVRLVGHHNLKDANKLFVSLCKTYPNGSPAFLYKISK